MSSSVTKIALNIALIHHDERQRAMLDKAFCGLGATVTSAARWSELAQHKLRLGGLWVIFDLGEETSHAIEQIRQAQEQAFWGILVLGQGDTADRQRLKNAGCDAYLKYPFDFPTLSAQIKAISEARTPISTYQILPQHVAAGLDRVWARFEQLNYYQLLELESYATSEEIKERFHQRSLLLHPDRHRSLKKSHPPVYDRVNTIYKRVLESYQTLMNPVKRPIYDTSLSRGNHRWNHALDARLKDLLSVSELEETQNKLLSALNLRGNGLLKPAYEQILSAIQREPNNLKLQQILSGYQTLLRIASRDREIASLLEQQVAP